MTLANFNTVFLAVQDFADNRHEVNFGILIKSKNNSRPIQIHRGP